VWLWDGGPVGSPGGCFRGFGCWSTGTKSCARERAVWGEGASSTALYADEPTLIAEVCLGFGCVVVRRGGAEGWVGFAGEVTEHGGFLFCWFGHGLWQASPPQSLSRLIVYRIGRRGGLIWILALDIHVPQGFRHKRTSPFCLFES